eukprot:COSAG01_NODE_5380_length_4295_cov_312.910867_7_plen_98_part_00
MVNNNVHIYLQVSMHRTADSSNRRHLITTILILAPPPPWSFSLRFLHRRHAKVAVLLNQESVASPLDEEPVFEAPVCAPAVSHNPTVAQFASSRWQQ